MGRACVFHNAGASVAPAAYLVKCEVLSAQTNVAPGSITEARRVMQRFLEVKRAQEDAGWEQGGLGLGFGESLMDTEFNRFFGKYQTRRLKELAADRGYLRQIVGKKLSAKQAEKYGVDVNDPDGLRKRKEELDALAERWKNPALHDDLMEEMRAAFKEEYAGEGWLDMQRVDNAPLMVQSRELGRADFNIEPPLNSEPFDVERYSERYLMSVESVYGTDAPTPEMVTDLWRQVVDAVVDRKVPVAYAQHLPVSPTPAVLRMLGVPERMMAVNNTVLLNKNTAPDYNNSAHQDHYVTREQFYELPEKMSDPLAVLVPKKKLKRGQLALCILTDMIEKRPNGAESNVIAAIHVEANAFTNGIKINKIASVYGKESIADWELVYEKEQPLESTEGLASTLQLLRRSPALVGANGRIYNEADLVNYKKETGANFSVIGERAETWEKYKDRAFKGRDDGMMRAELDASKAKLKDGVVDELRRAERGEMIGFLCEVLDFPELFEAYPWLQWKEVMASGGTGSSMFMSREIEKPIPRKGRIYLGVKPDGNVLGSLLHEVQHEVQVYEGFAVGVTNDETVKRVWSDLGREDELKARPEQSPSLYRSTAGEIEARNVTWRMFMTEEDRRNKAFNDTLDVGAEHALRFSANEYFAAMDAKRAAEEGLFKDGKMVAGNAVITAPADAGKPGATHFSVDGAQHVSPHRFKEFDLGHIGMGEGRQAYGWGLYFSSNWGVNKYYHRYFSAEKSRFYSVKGNSVSGREAVDEAKKLGAWVGGVMLGSREEYERSIKGLGEVADAGGNQYITAERARQEMEAYKRLLENEIYAEMKQSNAMNYLVDLAVEDGELLSWEGMMTYSRGDMWGKASPKSPINEEVCELLNWDLGGVYSGEEIYGMLAEKLGGQKAASEWLLERGVKGVRYEDDSYDHKEGDRSYNYVIFDSGLIQVRKVAERKPWSSDTEDAGVWEDYGEWVGGAHFSLGGERAATFGEMQEMGFTYFDPADGKRKFAMDTRGVRLSTGFTMGEVNVPAGGHKDVSLGALLHYPELYRAYPELRGMRVRLYRDVMSAVGGFYAPNGVAPGEGQHIAVNVGNMGNDKAGRLLKVLLHESQHAVQHHEGWSRGAGNMEREEAMAYVERAIAAREEQGGESEWAKFNLAYLKTKLKALQTLKAGDELEREVASVYVASHGEQEARYAGEGMAVRGENPWEGEVMRGVSGVAESWMTVPVPAEVTELGGITFGNAGAYAGIMQSRLAPVGDFYTDRKLFQIRDAAVSVYSALNRQ